MPQAEAIAEKIISKLQTQIGELVLQLAIRDVQIEVTISERDNALSRLQELKGQDDGYSEDRENL